MKHKKHGVIIHAILISIWAMVFGMQAYKLFAQYLTIRGIFLLVLALTGVVCEIYLVYTCANAVDVDNPTGRSITELANSLPGESDT